MRRSLLLIAVLSGVVLSLSACGKPPEQNQPGTQAAKVKIGFIIPVADNQWYQLEWKFAQEAADKNHFELIKLLASDGEMVLKTLDTLQAQGADGVIICPVDVRLGSSIVAKTKAANMKLIDVDDRMVGGDGKPLTEVHYLGIRARDIGKLVGAELYKEMQQRGWKPEETAAMAITTDTVETSRERTDGAIEVLVSKDFPAAQVFKVPRSEPATQTTAFNAANDALVSHQTVKHWLVFSSNDDGVLGAIRAMEGKQYKAADIIGIGIDGTVAVTDFKKKEPTGMYASVLLQPKLHGYGTAESMYRWVAEGKEPEKEHFTTGILITRENYVEEMRKQGLDPSMY